MMSAFEGLTVLELTSSPAGAVVGQFFADYGAEVVMVERPGGSSLRSQVAFPFWARGKRSLVLDLSSEADRARAWDLATPVGPGHRVVRAWRRSQARRRLREPEVPQPVARVCGDQRFRGVRTVCRCQGLRGHRPGQDRGVSSSERDDIEAGPIVRQRAVVHVQRRPAGRSWGAGRSRRTAEERGRARR